MSLFLSETFRDRLAAAPCPLAGGWVCSGSPLVAEIMAGAGFDWLLIDMEHGPNTLDTVLARPLAVDATVDVVLPDRPRGPLVAPREPSASAAPSSPFDEETLGAPRSFVPQAQFVRTPTLAPPTYEPTVSLTLPAPIEASRPPAAPVAAPAPLVLRPRVLPQPEKSALWWVVPVVLVGVLLVGVAIGVVAFAP